MRVIKPNWVNHDGQDIFSVDVHPDGSRFATGGQGKDSGKIVIWNMGLITNKSKENDENSPRILCQMDHHIACVNIVRWSNNGMFLASGSDDKLVMIWQYAHGSNYQNIENWKCGYTLRAHNGDVLAVAWCRNDEYLATCSIDNTIIIWNALKFPDIIQRINAHAGLVKGVTWDPVGSFLASQSDDKTVKIWRTSDWTLEKTIDEPFKQSAGTTHVLRLSWSPNGQLLISAHAVNNGVPTAQVINRTTNWNYKIDFVGHRKAVTVVRFYPEILKPNKDSEKSYCLCGLGSRDRSVSIWQTNSSRPLLVIQDLFDNPVMDLSWCKQPKPGMLACSTDGTIAYLEFDYKEIGYPLSKEETEKFFMKNYGHDIKSVPLAKTINSTGDNESKKSKEPEIKFIENFDALMAQEQREHQQSEPQVNQLARNPFKSPVMNENSDSLLTNRVNVLTENQKQIERKMADGRRRITPICVSKPGEYDAPRPFGSVPVFENVGFSQSIGFGSPTAVNRKNSLDSNSVNFTNEPSGTFLIEKRNEHNEIIEVSPAKNIVYNRQTSQNVNSITSAKQSEQTQLLRQEVATSSNLIINATTASNKVVKIQAVTATTGPTKPIADSGRPTSIPSVSTLTSNVTLSTASSINVTQKPKPVQNVVASASMGALTRQSSNTNLSAQQNNAGTEVASQQKEKEALPATPKKVVVIQTQNQQQQQVIEPLKAPKNSFTKIIV